MKYVLLANLGATLFMVGVIWFVRVVHYPLFSRVGGESFALYSEAHSRLTTYVVGSPMLVERRSYYRHLRSHSRSARPSRLRGP